MKRFLHVALFSVAGFLALPAAAADVGVSISIGQPGFYGTIDLGSHARPQVVYNNPIIAYPRSGPRYNPIYLRVPPGHMKKWGNYCGNYGACGRPVYFVTDNWYHNNYRPKHVQFRPAPHQPPHHIRHDDRRFKEHHFKDQRFDDRLHGKHDKHDNRRDHKNDRGPHGHGGPGHRH